MYLPNKQIFFICFLYIFIVIFSDDDEMAMNDFAT